MRWLRNLLLLGLLAGVGLMLYRHLRASAGREAPGGILIDNVAAYDATTGWLLGSFFRGVAADVAVNAPIQGRILEVGCGPGHLANRLAGEHALQVTGIDLDPAMVERAERNATRLPGSNRPRFLAADAATLPFADASFDVVVSTLSMHHWDDAAAGLAEIARVLAPGGQALIWDLGPSAPLHAHVPDPAEQLAQSPLPVTSVTPWRWPWIFSLTRRIELEKPES